MVMRKLLVLVLAAVVLSGCASMQGVKLDANKIALAYYNQNRTYNPVEISGVQSVTLSAAEGQTISVVLTSQLEPLSIYPRDPSTLAQLMDGLWKVGTVVGSTIVGTELVQGLSAAPKTVDPVIVKVPAE